MPIALSTWKHGFEPNRVTYESLFDGSAALDAVEAGAKFCEADLTCMSVGRGGIPDSEGFVTLDASIMDHEGNCGAVAFVRKYEHVASIARRVMMKTPHIMLVGDGAEDFAAKEGFAQSDLITEKARALWQEWSKQPDKLHVRLRRSTEGEHEYVFERIDDSGARSQIDRNTIRPVNESHDTIGILGLDDQGRLAGACTTSGLAFKLHGRVGDSPIIGAGLFVDGEVAAAVATGTGELVMRACSTFHVVEMIRQGIDPSEACERAIQRIARDPHLNSDMQVGIIALRADGAWSTRSLRPGFQVAAASELLNHTNTLFDVNEHAFHPAP
jgi:isoaspartyl peptidase/L-asparaginase-like protein (Ntn-hydrolase superfamily)